MLQREDPRRRTAVRGPSCPVYPSRDGSGQSAGAASAWAWPHHRQPEDSERQQQPVSQPRRWSWKSNNVEVVQYLCDDDPSRVWALRVLNGDDISEIINVNSGLCLTVAGGGTGDNTPASSSTPATATRRAAGA